MKQLIIGCGSSPKRQLGKDGESGYRDDVVRLDIEAAHNPTVVWDLENLPLPFADDSFDEIHAYHVMEHVGRQGDWRFFFAQWMDFWRILKPGGEVYIISPRHDDVWTWGDPGHTRVLCYEQMVFLHQPNYAQVGDTAMTDYRAVFTGDFDVVHHRLAPKWLELVVKAVKPSRCTLALKEAAE